MLITRGMACGAIVGVVLLGWNACYAFFVAAGWEIRRGEKRFILAWLDGNMNGPGLSHLHPAPTNADLLFSPGDAEVARIYDNGGAPFVVVNLDHFGLAAWWIGHRLRRLIDRIATREGIPVLPVPYTPWEQRVCPTPKETVTLVERRRRECVFTKTNENGTVHYLSGFDRNERPALYFLTQLPRPATSIADAREALKPASVILAERDGRKVLRQGDMFAVPTKFTDEQIKEAGGIVSDMTPLYGTAHIGEWVASLPDGTQLASDTLTHRPPSRDPDHQPLILKRGRWYLIAKNTTPMRPKGGE